MNASADIAVEADDFFSIDKINTFVTSPDGIFDAADASSQTLIREGQISIDFTLRPEYLDDLGYLNNGSFSFGAALKPDSADFLSCISSSSLSLTASEAGASISDDTTSTADGALIHEVSLSISDTTKDIAFNIIYEVKDYIATSDASSTSRGYLYNEFRNMGITFLLEAIKQ